MKSLLFLSVWLTTLGTLPLAAGDIVALCIGNNAYVIPEDQLDTPVNDARLMHETLRAVPGVQAEDVVLLEDAKRSQITLALRQFRARSAEAKLSLIYYSGHGVEDTPTGYDRAETFLLPVDAIIDSADDLPDKAVPLRTVLEALEGKRGGARAVILDCCRSGAPGATKSLVRVGKSLATLDEKVKKALGGAILPEGTLIAFAASPGRKAAAFLTDTDMNSPFTYFIAQQMSSQGKDILSIINAASAITKQRTELRQVPHVEVRGDLSLIMDYTIPAASPAQVSIPLAMPTIPPTNSELEGQKGMVIETPKSTARGSALPGVTQSSPFINSLGMKFVPVEIAGQTDSRKSVLFSVWETRMSDFEAFAETYPNIRQEWRNPRTRSLQAHDQPNHPVSLVAYEDAELFCVWLTERERILRAIPDGSMYRLPTDHEWSCAVGIGHLEDPSLPPSAKDRKLPGIYPWGARFPPPNGVGNYADQAYLNTFGDRFVPSLDDGYPTTAPVGSFPANQFGLYDMGGNVMEWCAGYYSSKNNNRYARGGCWFNQTEPYMLSSDRVVYEGANFMNTHYGIRVVLEVPSN